MGGIADLAKATEVVGSVCADLDALRDCEFWKIPDDGLLSLAQLMERVGRLVYAAQVQLTGQIDTRGVAERFGCTSTGALLRQSLNISAGDAAARVRAARAVLPRDLPTGGEAPPVLPLLGAALAQGAVGVEQTRTVVGTMNQLPAKVDHDTRELAQQLLVRHARINEPTVFAAFARQVALRCDPDGKLDERDPVDKVELTLGARSPSTGLTGFRGFLDDLGVETLSQAIDGLARPRPARDGTPDPRPAPVRRGQALVEALRRYLDTGQPPIQGGERPHVTVTMDRDALLGRLGAAMLEHGGPISAAQARMLACDALIIPAVLGSNSQVLDVGTANRVFTAAVRRAITLRDRGCIWDGCDRPAAWCDGHHVKHWIDNGPSSYDNGVLLCPRHHREIHRGQWEIRFAADRIPELIPPAWVDATRTPRRNTTHHNPFHQRT